MSLSSPGHSDDDSELENLTNADYFYIQDYIGNALLKGGYIYEAEKDPSKFWDWLLKNPFPTFEGYVARLKLQGTRSARSDEDLQYLESPNSFQNRVVAFGRTNPNLITRINTIVAAINRCSNIEEYKKLIIELYTIAYPHHRPDQRPWSKQ